MKYGWNPPMKNAEYYLAFVEINLWAEGTS